MRRYEAVFLDAQGTLLQAHPSVADLYLDACRRCGHDAAPAEMVAALREIWREYKRSTEGQKQYDTSEEITRQWWDDFNSRIFRRLGMQNGQGQFLSTLWEVFGHPGNWRTFPEVDEVLAELRRRGYRLGVVSNWDSRLLPICDHLGLTEQMEFVIASALVGVEKPDRRIFQMALSRIGISSDRAIHVGDDFEADVEGARGAGITAVLLDRDGTHPPERGGIPSLRGLLDILK